MKSKHTLLSIHPSSSVLSVENEKESQQDIQLHSVSAGVRLDSHVIIFWKIEHYVIVVAYVNVVIVKMYVFFDYPLLLLITSWEKS